ncbi:MAG TPA: radical SAM protein [Thermoanaerobaculia bacterium]
MISLTKLLGGASYFGDNLRYDSAASRQMHGTRPGAGPVVVWNATLTCNLECQHCYADAIRRRVVGELSTEEAKAMIDDLASFKVPALLMSGGEPLVRPDILDLAEYAISKGIRVTFSTNGTLISTSVAERLFKIGVTYVGISIDGSEAMHDRFRGKSGAFKEAIRGIRNARAAGIRVGIRFTVTSENVDDLPSVIQLVEQEGIGRLCIYHLVYSGRGSELAESELTPARKREMLEFLFRHTRRWNADGTEIEVLTVENHADAVYAYLWLLENDTEQASRALALLKSNGGNRSGIAIGAIDSFGWVHPDQFTRHHSIGSVRERPFSEIWTDPRSELMAGLRDRKPLLKGRCATCKWLDVCNGNFRVRAEAVTGDFWESDPACYLTDEEIA